MLSPKTLYDALVAEGVTLFTGVPDSLLKDFCAYVTDNTPAERNVITVNEGSAIALAMGHYLATGRVGLVYMQNSGLGNAVNPLTSLANEAVYGIPMLLVVGWRGQPGDKDEPQHVHMGRVTQATLEAVGVPHVVLPREPDAAIAAIREAIAKSKAERTPHAILVEKGTFEAYKLKAKDAASYELTRERAITEFAARLPAGAVTIATTGMPSRELFEVREARKEPHAADFLTVGGMGHASQIALGVALERPERLVYCLDGDGAALMHMGGLATIGSLAPKNYRHVVLNNAAHDSVGGQPTVAFQIDLCAVARACGYKSATVATDEASLAEALAALAAAEGPALVEVRVKKGNRPDLGRPTMKPSDLRQEFSANLQAKTS